MERTINIQMLNLKFTAIFIVVQILSERFTGEKGRRRAQRERVVKESVVIDIERLEDG
jgi:hypothetical protein